MNQFTRMALRRLLFCMHTPQVRATSHPLDVILHVRVRDHPQDIILQVRVTSHPLDIILQVRVINHPRDVTSLASLLKSQSYPLTLYSCVP